MARQEQKPDAVWYEFTDENIEMAFSGTAPENVPDSDQISQQAAGALEADFREYWDTVKDGMVLPVVSVFQTNRFSGMDHTVFVVYSTYKTTCAVVYGVNGDTVKRLGEAPAGFDFALSSVFEGNIEKGFIYQESGTVELTAEEYRLRKEEADRDLSDARIISFVPADFGAPGTGFDISSQESFSEYILANGTIL